MCVEWKHRASGHFSNQNNKQLCVSNEVYSLTWYLIQSPRYSARGTIGHPGSIWRMVDLPTIQVWKRVKQTCRTPEWLTARGFSAVPFRQLHVTLQFALDVLPYALCQLITPWTSSKMTSHKDLEKQSNDKMLSWHEFSLGIVWVTAERLGKSENSFFFLLILPLPGNTRNVVLVGPTSANKSAGIL